MVEQLKGGNADLSAQVEAVQRQNQRLWPINKVVWNFTKAVDQDVDGPNGGWQVYYENSVFIYLFW